jgi:hypothetical protein
MNHPIEPVSVDMISIFVFRMVCVHLNTATQRNGAGAN